ncbi:MAG: ABC transporter ATP-binding protein [Chloroflexota bacterium]
MSPAPHATAVDLRGVSHRFGATLALDDLTIELRAGSTVALLGRNGAGKSTTISIMLGLLAPTAGQVEVLGGPPADAIRVGRVGAMLQSGSLPAGATVGELVALAAALHRDAGSPGTLLDRAGLRSLATRRVEGLSGGEAQRVRFALAIAGDPDLVFLDEPTVAMDVEARRAFWTDMRAAADRGRTILFATHHLDEADQVADRIVVLHEGRVAADGAPSALRDAVGSRIIRFRLDGVDPAALAQLPGVSLAEHHAGQVRLASADADATVRALVARGVPFRRLEVASVDLEDAFLAITGGLPRAA